MSFSIGIVGLPNVGKSTLFKALTKKEVDIAPRPFTTIHPNYGRVFVPDERLEKIAKIIKPEKVTPTTIEFVDIAGLVKGAHKGEGLGNQFLAHIRNCNALVEVVRAFEAKNVEHVAGEINPQRDIEMVKVELLMKDLETIEKARLKLEKEAKDPAFAKASVSKKKTAKKVEVLEKIKQGVSREKQISDINLNDEEKTKIKEFQFLTEKPIVFLLNVGNEKTPSESVPSQKEVISLNLKFEEEVSELLESEREELKVQSNLDKLIVSCYNILDLITFYTVAKEKETKAWTLKKGLLAPQAGGIVHSDFEKKFIRATVIPWQKLIETTSWANAREKGWLQTVGKDYIVQDGDVIEFRI